MNGLRGIESRPMVPAIVFTVSCLPHGTGLKDLFN